MATLDFDPKDPVALTRRLIRCPSITPEEGGALALLDEVLAQHGFETHRLSFSEPGTPDIENLYARIGPDGPALVFAGHTDVVPPGDLSRWRQGPFDGEIVDGELYGRGAVDMKGGVAASVSAVLRHLAGGAPTQPIAFLITGDEEGPAINGTIKLLEWAKERGETFSGCLLAEPTNPAALGDAIKIGRRGSLSGTIIVTGVQGHAAYPHLAVNPIKGMMVLLQTLFDLEMDKGTAHFDPSTLAVTTVDVGNPAGNVIPGKARAAFNIRFNDLWTHETLAAFIAAKLTAAAGDITFTVTFEPSNSDAFLTAPGPFVERIVSAIEAEIGRRPALSTSGGTSDARFIKNYCPVVEFGLVGKTMHQVDERTSVADLESLTRVFERVLAG